MTKRAFEVSSAPAIEITECLGDLHVRGSRADRVEVRVDDDAELIEADAGLNALSLAARGDCSLVCPHGSSLAIGSVRGDVKIVSVEGNVTADSVSGNAVLRGVGPVRLGSIAGDLSVRGVAGDLEVTDVAADVRLRGLEGNVIVTRVGGDLSAEGLRGSLAADHVGADVRIGPPFEPGTSYKIGAGGSLRLTVPADASLRLAIKSGGRIRSTVPGLTVSEAGEGLLGAGEATVDAVVGGAVRIRPADLEPGFVPGGLPDLAGIGDQIEAQIADAMAAVESRFDETLGRIDSDEIRSIYERQAERTLRRTQEFARREGGRAERLAEQAQLRAERAERRWRRASGQPARERKPSVSNGERLQILRMVESGKVSPQEASDLLAALEGR